MGRAAAEGSDLVIVTSDNPRSRKSRLAILADILPGIARRQPKPNTSSNPTAAQSHPPSPSHAAKPGDIVLLAGKGHEKVQITATGTTPFDDVAEAALALQSLQEVTR